MRRSRAPLPVSAAACVALVASSALAQGPLPPALPSAPPPGDASAFETQDLAPGVILFRPSQRGPAHTNSLVVERDDGLLVVDAQPSEAAARDLLAAIASKSAAAIRFLVLTHPHAAAAGGARAFPDSALRIASRGFRDAVADPAFDFDADLAARGALPVPPPRPRPTLVLFGRTRLEDPRNPVVLMPLPPAHTPGDLLVMLPDVGVVEAGGLPFPDRNPYAVDADVAGWLAQLNQLIGIAPRWIAGLEGPPQNPAELASQRDTLAWIRNAVDDAFADRVAPETITDTVLAAPGAARRLDLGARPSFARGLVERVVEEARARRRAIGLE